MPEDVGDKTEPATPKRRQESWESGHFPKSQDLTSGVLLLGGIIALGMLGPAFVRHMSTMMRDGLGHMPWSSHEELVTESLRLTVPHAFKAVAPFLVIVAVVALLASVLQVGFRTTTKPLMPSLAKLNPLAGLGRMFKGQNWFQLGMNVVKLVVVGSIVYWRIKISFGEIMALHMIDFPENFARAAEIIYGMAWRVALALVIIGCLDWIWHKWKFERDIRMTKQEVKEEAKRNEGDLEIKARRRQLARKMIMQGINRDVPHADVVVTNPTELAIAIKYDPTTMAAPRVVAKGAGFLAARIRQVAIANGVPIIERKPLAQALYKTVDVGQEVPPHLYQAIAEILAYVYELAGKGMRRLKQAV